MGVRNLGILLALLLAGCATTDGYSQFFTPVPGATPEAIAAHRANPPPQIPAVIHSDDPYSKDFAQHMMEQGYVLIGTSSFTSGYRQSDANAVKEGQQVAADLVVVVSPRFSRSVTAAVPFTTPTTSTSYSTGTATAYGPGGSAVAFGSSTTTTYGTNTTYLPMTVNRFQYGALYFVKERYRLGIRYRNLTDDERQELGSNHGVYIMVVVDGSPAYEDDILPGDVITAVDGTRVDGGSGLEELLKEHAAQTVTFTIARQGHTITKRIPLGSLARARQ